MSHILGPRNEALLLPWYPDFTNGLENFSNLSNVMPTVALLLENIIHDGWRYTSVDTKHFNSQGLNICHVN